jgi:hypothetical protein
VALVRRGLEISGVSVSVSVSRVERRRVKADLRLLEKDVAEVEVEERFNLEARLVVDEVLVLLLELLLREEK